MKACCHHDCDQGDECPLRTGKVFPHATGHSQKSQPAQVQPAQTATKKVASFSTKVQMRHLLQWTAIMAATSLLLACIVQFISTR